MKKLAASSVPFTTRTLRPYSPGGRTLRAYPSDPIMAAHNPSTPPNQAPITIATLPRITPSSLSTHILSAHPSLAIVDVRDSDHIGGHIKGSTHVPSPSLDAKLPELVRELRGKEVVVFHCMLSQQRGPAAAVRYLRERERERERERQKVLGKGEGGQEEEEGKDKREGGQEEGKTEGGRGEDGKGQEVQQKVYVLDGGFDKWQQKFGGDQRLTEGYVKGLWDHGY